MQYLWFLQKRKYCKNKNTIETIKKHGLSDQKTNKMVELKQWKMSVLKLSETPSARAELAVNSVFVLAERGIRKRIIVHLWTLFLLQMNIFTVLPICWIRKILEIWSGISLRMDEACFHLVLTLTRTPGTQHLAYSTYTCCLLEHRRRAAPWWEGDC